MTARLGGKVRGLRRREGLSQIQLASTLEISPSYLNLIEHNQRPLPSHLLVKLAQFFHVELSAFADEGQTRLADDLQEVFGDALFEEHPLTTNDVRELADNSAAARAVIALYHAYRSTVDSTRALSAKLYDGRDFLGIDPAHMPSEEVSELIQANMNYFAELEAAAGRVTAEAHLDRSDIYRSLVAYLREKHAIEVTLTPVSRDAGVIRRFDPERRVLAVSEILAPWSRNFQLAYQIGLTEGHDDIAAVIDRSTTHLTTPESVRLCRVALANYFAAALLMPYDEFLRCAEEMRYDVELLQHHFTASWEQVCHRLTTLRKPSAPGMAFHFVRVDIAGNMSKRFSGTGIRFARFSGSCPRWDVHAAFLTPGRIRTQLSIMPDGTAYFCIARTVRKSRGFGSGDMLMAVGIGCAVADARKIVYAGGYDLDNLDAAVPIGTTCRLCERVDCEQRAFPALQHGMTIDENVRGRSFFAPAIEAPPSPKSRRK
ncbi:MAG: helix-turn-helix domain-containing protein [Thermoanaerobaculia bacterium]